MEIGFFFDIIILLYKKISNAIYQILCKPMLSIGKAYHPVPRPAISRMEIFV